MDEIDARIAHAPVRLLAGGKFLREDAYGSSRYRRNCLAGIFASVVRKEAECIVMSVEANPDLFQMVGTLGCSRGLSRNLNRREQECQQQRDDTYRNNQIENCEPMAMVSNHYWVPLQHSDPRDHISHRNLANMIFEQNRFSGGDEWQRPPVSPKTDNGPPTVLPVRLRQMMWLGIKVHL